MPKRIVYYIITIWLTVFVYRLDAQPGVRIIAPEKPVNTGEPFRVQFVVENISSAQRFIPPSFYGLKIIRGPEKYDGSQLIDNRKMLLTNYVYTLVAERPGAYKIESAIIRLNDKDFFSSPVSIIVKNSQPITADEDMYPTSALRPGEDAMQKIKENLFVKLFVDRRNCFVGEPVLATFKLFSRLQSKSDIVKNPGFYGFGVHDMINLDDRVKERERINGKDFEVHTIRKVQLYPLQPGRFIIDEMKIENRVVFSQSMINSKTEQQISEGILNREENEAVVPGTEVFETSFATEPVVIQVKPLPEKNKPPGFNGAAGDFTIRAAIEKNELDRNEQGFLTITVEGRGNFTQITPPVIQWPQELEGFEPTVKDFLDKRNVPLTGSRIFRYPFVSSAPGKWTIAAPGFCFFNTPTHSYKTITVDRLTVTITAKEFRKAESASGETGEKKVSIEQANKRVSRIAFTLVAIAVVSALSYWAFKGRRKKYQEVIDPDIPLPAVDFFFGSINKDETVADKDFFKAVQQAAWLFLSAHYQLSGSGMNKDSLAAALRLAGNDELLIEGLMDELNILETALFTGIELNESNRAERVEKMRSLLARLK
jgi:hypothetical protein